MKAAQGQIVVVGSVNIDWVTRVTSLPRAGQTVAAGGLTRHFGGKGANQAIAAARQGAEVSFIGCIGDDDSGRAYREHFRHEGIGDGFLETIAKSATGTAFITVDDRGENTIVVAEGANGLLRPARVRAGKELIKAAGAVLVQWEVPRAAVIETGELCRRLGVPLVMNPSPIQSGFPWGEFPLHTLIVNEGEAEAIFGRAAARAPARLSKALAARGITRLIVTRGAAATRGITADEVLEIPALPVEPIDTVGAGDAFAGTYTACLTRGDDFLQAIRHANAAGALATLKPGAQPAIPTRRAVDRAVKRFFHSTPR